ncbi:MAG: acyl carrier protein [Candidatus Accumulibacter delftensis]|jgi:phthiocerol/phenolphthiocerol synthesis type-I polyketide synthase C
MGGSALNSATALDALEGMLLADRPDWRSSNSTGSAEPLAADAGSPKFRELAWHAEADSQEDHSEDIQRLLAELPDDELLAAFIDILQDEIGEILRVAPDKIDPNRSLYDMGLDSLMGVELMIALETRFGIRLPVMA